MQPEDIRLSFEEFLDKTIERLKVNSVFDLVNTVDGHTVKYEDYLPKFGPNGGDEHIDVNIKHIANLDNLGRFAVNLEQVDAQLLETIAEVGIEDILPTDLVLPDNCGNIPAAPWETLNTELTGLYKAVNVYEFADGRQIKRTIDEPSVSHITPFMEGIVRVNKAASLTFKRLGLEDAAKHFAERAEVLDLIYDQRLAFEGKPTVSTVVDKRYEGSDFVKTLAAEHIDLEGKKEPQSLDAYLIIVDDDAHPSVVPGFNSVKHQYNGWHNKKYTLAERKPEILELMAQRVQGDWKEFGFDRSPGSYGPGPFYNAVGEFGFTQHDDMIMAMYIHFSGELAKEFSDKHPNGVTYLTWLFEPDFEPTGTLTKEQMLNSEIVKITSRFIAGETDKSKIFEGMDRFILSMIRMTGVTHRMYDKSGISVFPTLFSDLTVDHHMADLVLNYQPKVNSQK